MFDVNPVINVLQHSRGHCLFMEGIKGFTCCPSQNLPYA